MLYFTKEPNPNFTESSEFFLKCSAVKYSTVKYNTVYYITVQYITVHKQILALLLFGEVKSVKGEREFMKTHRKIQNKSIIANDSLVAFMTPQIIGQNNKVIYYTLQPNPGGSLVHYGHTEESYTTSIFCDLFKLFYPNLLTDINL